MLAQTTIIGAGSRPSARLTRSDPAGRGRETAEESLAETMRLMGAVLSYSRNSEIFGENEPAEYLYKVVSGAVRTYKILSDGRRQIGGFYLPGEVFGLSFDAEHVMSAEAIVESKVLVVRRNVLEAFADRHPSIGRELFTVTGRELQRVQNRILLLIKSAQERVAGFLMEMADRASTEGAVDLPMSRQDIADYLGLTIETVSRTLTALEHSRAIDVPTSRRIVLRNLPSLHRMVR